MDSDRQVSDQECLELAVFAISCTVRPEGLCPILLVYGAVPRPARTTPALSQLERARMVENIMKEIEKEHAKRRISFGLRHNKGPKGKESSEPLRRLPAGAPVLIYKTKTKRWEGPFKFINIDGETVVVQTDHGRKIFQSTYVRPLNNSAEHMTNLSYGSPEAFTAIPSEKEKHPIKEDNGNDPSLCRPLSRNTRKQCCDSAGTTSTFMHSRAHELRGLMENGTFQIVSRNDLPDGIRVFGSKFIDQVKHASAGVRYKSRLVAQNYGDNEAASIATKAPAVQRFTQRLMLSLAASLSGVSAHSRDITQAYIQGKTPLERNVYITPAEELGISTNHVLKVVKPLYGIPESRLHWYLTYIDHHTDKLGMTRARADPCLLYKHERGSLQGMVILQVDDSLVVGTESFLDLEEDEAKAFVAKPRKALKNEPILFGGILITQAGSRTIRITQSDKIDRLAVPNTEKGFASQRALAQYIGVSCRPDICASVQLIAPRRDSISQSSSTSLNKTIQHLQKSRTQGPDFVPTDVTTLRVIVISDASFANACGMKSQLGSAILMTDAGRRANIVYMGQTGATALLDL